LSLDTHKLITHNGPVVEYDPFVPRGYYVFTLARKAISWKSSKQTCIARLIMELELITLEKAGIEDEWLKKLLVNLFEFMC
jgi:hypothetical protein